MDHLDRFIRATTTKDYSYFNSEIFKQDADLLDLDYDFIVTQVTLDELSEEV